MEMTNIGSAAWGFRALELPRQLETAFRLGMTCHELGIANAPTDLPLDASEKELTQVKALYERCGIALTCAATGNDFTGDDAPQQLRKVRRVIELCACLGVRKLRVFAGFTPLDQMTPQKWQVLLSSMKQAAEAATAAGVTLCVETHGAVEPMLDGVRHIRSSTTQIGDLQRILEAAPVQIVFDPANLHAVGEDALAAFLEAFRSRIGYVHLKDFRTGPQGQLYPCALGDGGTAWEKLAKQLLALEVPILFEYENCEDLEAGLAQCIACWRGVN